MAAAWNELPATGGLHECAALVSSAEALRVSAPELSVQLARRAMLVGATDASAGTTNAGEARHLSMRAQALLVAGLVRVSQHAKAVEPGFAALALAETGGVPDVVAEVRIDLAACAQQVGEPLLGGAILRPVLEAAHTPPSVRATALGRLVGCVAHVARRDDVEDALAEADRLLAADDGVSSDLRRLERARLAVRTAGYHRWYGDTEDAITAAREGLNLLTRLRSDLLSESDRLRARLVLELVCGLLDEGELGEAVAAAHPTVDEPVRATSAASVGRLMLAVATRVHLPAGQTDRGRHLLDQAAWMAERHALDGLRADVLTEVSRLDEEAGRATDALEALRSARAAEHRRLRAVSRAARIVLVEVGAGHGVRDTAQQSVAVLMRQLAHPAGLPVAVAPPPVAPPPPKRSPEPQKTPPAAPELAGTVDMEQGNGLLDREGLFRRLRSVRKAERPVALTLVRFEPNKDGDKDGDKDGAGNRGPDTGIMAGLADKVRHMAPDNAELARSDGGELAVLLPATTRDQAEEFAATIRESDWAGAGGRDMSISTGVVHTDQATTDDGKLDAAGILTAARDALTPAQTTNADSPTGSPSDTAAALQSALQSALSEETPTKPLNSQRPAEQQPGGRSILSSLSIPSGSGGRRRAGEEQPPGGKSRWPAEPAEAPRWTRAERRAQAGASRPIDPTSPPTGWPVPADEPSQGKRAASPTKPPFSETRTGETTTGIDRPQLPARHGKQPGEPTTPTNNEPARTTADPQDTQTPSDQVKPGRHGSSPPRSTEAPLFGTPDETPGRGMSARHGSVGDSASFGMPESDGSGASRDLGVAARFGWSSAGAGDSPAFGAPDSPADATSSSPGSASGEGTSLSAETTDAGFFSSLAGLSSGGILHGSGEHSTSERSSYEETKAELARMMSALNARSRESREAGALNGQSIPVPPTPDDVPEPPARPDVPEPPEPDPIPPVPEPETGRSGLMAAFDALTGPVPGLRAEFDDSGLPARKPAESWAQIESAGTVESPADKLFGTEPAEKIAGRSSLGAAFAEFGTAEKNVTEPVKETVQEPTYDEPIGPQPRPNDLPRRGERSSATIASLLTEALAAYQSTAEDSEPHRAPERFDSFVGDDSDRQQSRVPGRHRSPE